MNFYKIIDGQTFIGIATTDDLRVYLHKFDGSKVDVVGTENNAQYINVNGVLYHPSWCKAPEEDVPAQLVQAEVITKEEFDAIAETIEKGEEPIIVEEPTEPVVEEPQEDESTVVTVEYVRGLKLAEISRACNQAIVSGLDITLSDEKAHHFSLTEQDQSNLIALSLSVAQGETAIPYHADDELCVFYSPEDITKIVGEATAYITYHTTYHNSLKAYVKSLRSVNTIARVEYGMEIPAKYQSEVLVALLAQANE